MSWREVCLSTLLHGVMERSLEQQYAIKFCVRLGMNATETYQMLQEAFKEDCISRSQSGRWHKAFTEGREDVADEPRSGRPSTAITDDNVKRVRCTKCQRSLLPGGAEETEKPGRAREG